MCKLVKTLRITTRDGISNLTSFQVEIEPKSSLARVMRNRLTRSQKIRFLRFKICCLAFKDLKGSTKNLHFKFGIVLS